MDDVSGDVYDSLKWEDNDLSNKYRDLLKDFKEKEREFRNIAEANESLTRFKKDHEAKSGLEFGGFSSVDEYQMNHESETIAEAVELINNSPDKAELIDLFLEDVADKPENKPPVTEEDFEYGFMPCPECGTIDAVETNDYYTWAKANCIEETK